jgi:hypothetical protein
LRHSTWLLETTGLVPSKGWYGGYAPLDGKWWFYTGIIGVQFDFPSHVVAGRQVPLYGTTFGTQTTYARFIVEHKLTGGGWW